MKVIEPSLFVSVFPDFIGKKEAWGKPVLFIKIIETLTYQNNKTGHVLQWSGFTSYHPNMWQQGPAEAEISFLL